VSELFLLTNATESAGDILPALGLLLHTVRTAPAEAAALADAPAADAVLIDARRDLVHARELCRLLRAVGQDVPVVAIMTEGGLAAVTAEWGADDVVLHTAGPAEVEARLRLAMGRQASLAPTAPDEIRSGDLSIDEATYTARLRARVLDLTFKEFELLKFLAQHPGRVFTRAHLLQEVWGYDYFGGTRTVDVHVRRLRAKLGPEHEALIGTVRNVGYRFVPLKGGDDSRRMMMREVTGDSAGAEDGQDSGQGPVGQGPVGQAAGGQAAGGQAAGGHASGGEQRMESNGAAPPASDGREAGRAGGSREAGSAGGGRVPDPAGGGRAPGPVRGDREAGRARASRGAGPARASR
jgi:DNA-binding response OmpR family regulator